MRNKNQVRLLRKGVLEQEEPLLLEINKKNEETNDVTTRRGGWSNKAEWETFYKGVDYVSSSDNVRRLMVLFPYKVHRHY